MGPNHERWEDAAGTYVLGAMPQDERIAYEEHLSACPICRAEADELGVTASVLPLGAPAMRPPDALKSRIMAEVEREAELLASAVGATRQAAPPAKRERRARWRLPMPAVAFGCAALIAGVVAGGVLFGAGSDARSIPMQSTMQGASAEIELTDKGMIVVANNLETPDAGKVYMVWIQRPGQAPEPTSALFTPRRDGSATASVTGDMDGVETVLINTEPLGGSTTPTTQPFLIADLS